MADESVYTNPIYCCPYWFIALVKDAILPDAVNGMVASRTRARDAWTKTKQNYTHANTQQLSTRRWSTITIYQHQVILSGTTRARPLPGHEKPSADMENARSPSSVDGWSETGGQIVLSNHLPASLQALRSLHNKTNTCQSSSIPTRPKYFPWSPAVRSRYDQITERSISTY